MSEKSSKSVLITGSSGGIGRAAVEAFLDAGWHVLAVDAEEGDAVEATFFKADLGDEAAITALLAEVSAHLGDGLHALVNNAAVQDIGPLTAMDAAHWDRTMSVNLRAPFLLAKALLPHLAKAQGAIVNVASVHALATSAGIGAYAASKGGLLALTRSMAIEFAEMGVRVNAVLPGATDTEMLTTGLARGAGSLAENRKTLEEKILLRRLGKPPEIARAILFLADGEQASYITGQGLVVDGGATARLSTE